jgi:hypothetical protein
MKQVLANLVVLAALLAFAPRLARAQAEGPIAPPPTYTVKRLPSVPHPDAPAIPEQQIVQRFAANEDVMKKALANYTYTQSVRYEEETEPLGVVSASGDTYFKDDGQRYWRIVKEPKPTTKYSPYTVEDVMTMTMIPQFFLGTADIAQYNFLYAGEQQLDEINTYVFQVKPKMLSRKQRLFEGVVWVDEQDFAIVRTWGKFELLAQPEGNRLPFTMFETYRENFEDKYWLPTYVTSDDEVAAPDGSKVPVKLVVRETDFKPRAAAAASPAPPSPLQPPPPEQ